MKLNLNYSVLKHAALVAFAAAVPVVINALNESPVTAHTLENALAAGAVAFFAVFLRIPLGPANGISPQAQPPTKGS
jgi:hypothetical protein